MKEGLAVELIPCPFCGGAAELHFSYPPFGGRKRSTVRCTQCKCNSGDWGRVDMAITAWNRRNDTCGEWVPIDDDPPEDWECNRCGEPITNCGYDALPNFCPNCGARNRE